jgi:hypothetical protein
MFSRFRDPSDSPMLCTKDRSCHSQKCEVQPAKSVTIDIGPAFFNSLSGEWQPGYHGEVLGCNREEATCYGPSVGDQGFLVEGPHVYEGPNVSIRWKEAGVTATYALHEEY